MIELPYRHIHMDFHTSPAITDVARRFDPEAFADTLVRANVESVTCFARCHHGWMYYDSKRFPELVHPHLANRNLLADQIAACHDRGLRVPVYTTVQWDHHHWQSKPDWCVVGPDGQLSAMETPGYYEPGFYGRLCVNTPYREFLKAHTREVLETLSADGMFFDIVGPRDCSCRYCRQGMEDQGLDPADATQRLQYGFDVIRAFMREMTELVHAIHPDATVYYNNGNIGPGRHDQIDAFTHLEFDALPSEGPGGYMNFPLRARFERNLGRPCIGQTGRFHRTWGDFHTLKSESALEYECFQLLALNCRCMIGDQLAPDGRLEEEAYERIGRVYASVREKQPWCEHARAVCDIAVMSAEPTEDAGTSMIGTARMLTEAGHQFDIVDATSDLTGYRVLILPDRVSLGDEQTKRINAFLDGGGRLLASFESALAADGQRFRIERMGVRPTGADPIAPDGRPARGRVFHRTAYGEYIRGRGLLPDDQISRSDRAMYTAGLRVEAPGGAEVLADLIAPVFYRTWRHFCSHEQSPSSGQAVAPAIVHHAGCIYFSHAVFDLYARFAPPWVKAMVLAGLARLLPEPLVRHDGPSTLEVFVNELPDGRRVAHLLHYLPQRRAERLETITDTLTLGPIGLSIRADTPIEHARLVPDDRSLAVEPRGQRVELVVPAVHGHAMVELSAAGRSET